jgi:hypothetical protein
MPRDAARGIAGVDDQLRGLDDHRVIVAGVIGGDEHAVVCGQRLAVNRHGFHSLEIVVAQLVNFGEVRIIVIYFCAAQGQLFDDL